MGHTQGAAGKPATRLTKCTGPPNLATKLQDTVMAQQVDKVANSTTRGKPILSRGQLQGIEDDPAKMEVVARLMGAVNLDNLFRHMQNPDINPQTRIEFQKMLNKMGRLEPEEKVAVADAGPQVVINITRAVDTDHSVTIEGKAVNAPD